MSTADLVPGRYAGAVRIVAWNCQQKAEEKFEALRRLEPDVVVLAESRAISPNGWSVDWIGRNTTKGLAAMSRPGVTISRYAGYDPAWEWFLPVEVGDGGPLLSVLAVWAMNHRGAGPCQRVAAR